MIRAPAAAALLVLLTGCGKDDEAQSCDAVVASIQDEIDAFAAVPDAQTEDFERSMRVAARIIVNNEECFDARLVAQAQEAIADD